MDMLEAILEVILGVISSAVFALIGLIFMNYYPNSRRRVKRMFYSSWVNFPNFKDNGNERRYYKDIVMQLSIKKNMAIDRRFKKTILRLSAFPIKENEGYMDIVNSIKDMEYQIFFAQIEKLKFNISVRRAANMNIESYLYRYRLLLLKRG